MILLMTKGPTCKHEHYAEKNYLEVWRRERRRNFRYIEMTISGLIVLTEDCLRQLVKYCRNLVFKYHFNPLYASVARM